MLAYLAQNKFFRKWFGDFEKEELKKFIFLGMIFALVIGVYWTLRPLKDSIFSSMVHDPSLVALDKKHLADYIPWAKIVSLIFLFPLVMIYGRAIEKFPRQHMFYALGTIYTIATVGFGLYFMYSPWGLANQVGDVWRFAGWGWYVFVESYGSLMVALFWAFASDITTPDSAKRGFALTVMLGQLGSICGPLFLTPLGKTYFGSSGPTVLICGLLIILIMLGIKYFIATTPKELLVGFHGKNEAKEEAEQEPGFLEGLKLMVSHKYLLGLFGIIAIYEILATIIDYNFKSLVMATFSNEAERSAYLGDYAVWVNLVAFLCLLFGVNNIQRYLGVKFSLSLMPFIIGGFIALFLIYGNVTVLFWIMVLAKAINYALNNPVMKQLYVPTTSDVKYKSQAWIETFGSRSSKATGSVFNILKSSLGNYFIIATSLIAFGLCSFWFLIAIYLGNTYQKAVDEKKVVC